MFAPARAPRPIIETVNSALVRALWDPVTCKTLINRGGEAVAGTPEDHDAFNNAWIAKSIKVAQGAGIELR